MFTVDIAPSSTFDPRDFDRQLLRIDDPGPASLYDDEPDYSIAKFILRGDAMAVFKSGTLHIDAYRTLAEPSGSDTDIRCAGYVRVATKIGGFGVRRTLERVLSNGSDSLHDARVLTFTDSAVYMKNELEQRLGEHFRYEL